ncbi:MAG: proton-conducting transporter membrane subunit [Planctomycetota bacterium]|nr:proton-conducting transporter membrane subunit [Planctomycetota bacterium]
MTAILVLPPVIALLALALLRWPALQRRVSIGGGGLLALAAVNLAFGLEPGEIRVWVLGGWPAPLGIVWVADRLAAALVAVAAFVGAAALVAASAGHDEARQHPLWHPLAHLLLWAVCGAFLTGDLFNLFVWFEVMLMASFVLMALGGGRERLEGAVKYVAMNLISSVLFLCGCGILYGVCGTLNAADLARVIGARPEPAVLAGGGCLLAAFLLKSAAFPLFAWLPASYHTTTPATAALFSALLTKVGVYAVLRLTVTVMPIAETPLQPLLLWLSLATMVVGVLGAATQMELKRILAFHIISQVGYMLLGIALGSAPALAAAAFYLIHHIIVKSNLFLIAGLAAAQGGSDDVRRLGGLRQHPALYAGFIIAAGSLAGLPPLSGFFAKLATVRAASELAQWTAVVVALLVGFFTLYSMLKIHREVFAKDAPSSPAAASTGSGSALVAIVGLAAVTVGIGIAAGMLWRWALSVGAELAARTPYITAVLGGPR